MNCLTSFLYRAYLVSFFLFVMSDVVWAANSQATAMAIDLTGQLVLVGSTVTADNTAIEFAIAKLNPDGTFDTSFGNGTGQVTLSISDNTDIINAVAIDANNNIVVAGTSGNGYVNSFAIARFLPTGDLDTTFNSQGQLPGGPGVALVKIGSLNDTANAVGIDSLGNIIAAGTTDNGTNLEIAVVRLTSEGGLDPTFTEPPAANGILTYTISDSNDTTTTSVAIGPDNSIYAGGYTFTGINQAFFVMKFTPTGAIDTTYNAMSMTPGMVVESLAGTNDSQAYAMKLDSQNRIVMGGFVSNGTTTSFAVMRLTTEGDLDPTFNPNATPPGSMGYVITTITEGNNNSILALTFDSNDNIVVTGYANTGQNNEFATARYTTTGDLDTTFNSVGYVITNVVPAMDNFRNNANQGQGVVVDANNNIYTTGFSSDGIQVNFTTINYLVDGSFNTAFNSTGAMPGILLTIFNGETNLLGNGVEQVIYTDTSGVREELLESFEYPPLPQTPEIELAAPLVTNDQQPTIRGTAAPNTFVTLYANEEAKGSARADAQGKWTATLSPLLDGTYTILASSLDALSGLTVASLPAKIIVNTQSPTVPTIETPRMNQVSDSSTVEVRGRAQAGTTVYLYVQLQVIKVPVSDTGLWATELTKLDDGEYTMYATSIDKAGNQSGASDEVVFIVDTALRPPVITSPHNGLISNKNTVVITGTAKARSEVRLLLNDKPYSSVKADDLGNWKVPATKLKNGDYRLKATTANKNVASKTLTFTVNVKPPRPLTLKVAGPQKKPLSGTAIPSGSVTLYNDGKLLGRTVADENGSWSFTPHEDQTIEPGKHSLKISFADKDGNIKSIVDQQVDL